MSEYLVELIKFGRDVVTVIAAGWIFTICLFNLPKQYKKRKKFQCFVYLSLGFAAIMLFVRAFC